MATGNLNAVTDGLVLYIDTNNIKSYVGPPLQNFASQISITTGTGTGYAFTGSTSTDYVPGLQLSTTVSNCVAQNNYSAQSSWCCPSLFDYGNITTGITGSTLYTYGILYYSQSGYTHPNYLYRYEYNTNTYLTESGIFSDSNRSNLGSGWYWAWGTFTTQATTNRLILYSFYYRYSTFTDRIAIAKVALLKGNYTGLNPLKWPEIGINRGVTTCLKDLAGSNTFDLTNTVFGTDGSITFNGSSSYIISPENSALNTQTPTVEVWVKTNSLNQNGFWFEKGQVNTQYSLFQEGTNILWRQNVGSTVTLSTAAASFISTSQWAQVVGTYTSGVRRLYVNGRLVNSDTQAGTISTNTNGSSIGVYGGYNGSRGFYYNGSLAIVKVYNRALTPSEVLQNFNSTRSRFNL